MIDDTQYLRPAEFRLDWTARASARPAAKLARPSEADPLEQPAAAAAVGRPNGLAARL